jgi:glycerate 2-kinase
MPASTPPRVLVAFDKFKGALGAEAACDAARRAILRLLPSAIVDSAPLTDGGDGFCRILTRAAQGELHERSATGPRFEDGRAPQLPVSIGIVALERLPPLARARLSLDGDLAPGARRIAVIDMASVNGLARVPRERIDVWLSSSYGTGELILAAQALGADAILLGVGGSASSDLGLGALAALGLRFYTPQGDEVRPPLPATWPHIARIAGTLPTGLPPLRIACDVDNPVFGERGAAAVYGPQKGLTPAERPRLEAQGQRLATLLCQHVGASSELLTRPGSGAAGGIAFGLAAAAGARLVPGWALVEAWLGLDERLRAADWVITGEGRFDASSWDGKGPGSVVAAARALARPAVVFAGSISDDARAGAGGGTPCELIAISDPADPLEHALPATEPNLERRVDAWVRARLVAGHAAG